MIKEDAVRHPLFISNTKVELTLNYLQTFI